MDTLNHQYAELAWERKNLLVDVARIEKELRAIEYAIAQENEEEYGWIYEEGLDEPACDEDQQSFTLQNRQGKWHLTVKDETEHSLIRLSTGEWTYP